MPRAAMTKEEIAAIRRRILQEAAVIVAEEGIGALSMRRLAAKLGLTGGALYRYFESREELVPAHFSLGLDELHAQLTITGASADPLTALRDYTLAYADFAISNPVRFRLMFLENNHATENAGLKFGRVDELYGEFVRRTKVAIEAQLLRPGDPKMKADVLYAGVHGAVTLSLTAPELQFGDPRSFVELTVDTILSGLMPEKTSAS